MDIALIPENETDRLNSLLSYNILDTEFNKDYDEIVSLASYICDTPIALISLVDSDRQWFKAKVGLEANETPRDVAFCSHAINMDDILVVNDTFKDNRFFDNPLVVKNPNIRFYAGAQLKTDEGHVLGTLCAIDRKPRELSDNQLNGLKILSKQVMARLELRKSYAELKKYSDHLNIQNENKNKLFRIISHDLRSPFHSIMGLADILKEDINELSHEDIKELSSNISETATNSFELVNNLLNWSLHQSELKERELQEINLSKLFTKLISVLSGVITKKGINIVSDLDSKCNIFVDYNIIYSALQNVVSNAIKFTPRDGTIYISSKFVESKIMIEIKDTGVGLTQNEIKALLSPNGKSSTNGTGGERGTGLGFNIAKDFIYMSGGKLDIESELKVGTKVKIVFDVKTKIPVLDKF